MCRMIISSSNNTNSDWRVWTIPISFTNDNNVHLMIILEWSLQEDNDVWIMVDEDHRGSNVQNHEDTITISIMIIKGWWCWWWRSEGKWNEVRWFQMFEAWCWEECVLFLYYFLRREDYWDVDDDDDEDSGCAVWRQDVWCVNGYESCCLKSCCSFLLQPTDSFWWDEKMCLKP